MSENTENTENTEKEVTKVVKPTITVAGKTYLAESLNQKGMNIISDIKKVETAIGEKQRDISICNVAKVKLVELFMAETGEFTEIQVSEAPKE